MQILMFIIIGIIFLLFVKLNYKKCETGKEKIVFILYVITCITPVIIYYLDLWNIPSTLKLTNNINTQNWLSFLSNYTSSIVSTIIGVTASIYLALFQIRKNSEDTEKRDKENLRLQNIPLLKYDLKEENTKEIKLNELDTDIENGIIQQINLSFKNIGLNTIRKSYIKINSDILNKEYCFQLSNQSSIEINHETILQFVLKLFVNTTYKFELTIYYQDLLFNNYEQKVVMEYEVLSIHNGRDNYYYNYKFIPEDERNIKEIPKLNLEEL